MELEKIRSIIIPTRIRAGITKYKGKFRKVHVAGIDTETVMGKLFSIQFANESHRDFKLAKDMSVEEILDYFFSMIPRGTTIMFSHNLYFEVSAMFHELIEDNEQIIGNYKVEIIHPTPCWMKISCLKGTKNYRKSVEMIDTMAFFKGSLASVAEKFNLEVKKLEHPSYLGQREPTDDELPYFMKYAMTDAIVAFYLGKEIQKMHNEYDIDVRGTVSPATFSSKVFRKHYVNYIPYNRTIINKLAMLSYHGGRTESLIYGTVKCKVWDVNSAYPFSCTKIPVPVDATKWKYVREFGGEDGFYRMSGFIPEKKVSPMPYRNNRLMFPVGRFKNIFVTGYEAKRILECCKVERIKGYVYKGESDDCLKNFVEDFYKKKNESAENPVMYIFNKILLNGNYGKFMQLNPVKGEQKNVAHFIFDQVHWRTAQKETKRKFVAGGMFNPVIASWITGYARAHLYDMMNEYEEDVFYCDTDSIATTTRCRLPNSNKLGDVKLEKEGLMTILREKLYIMHENDKVVKSATHGYWKRGDDLWTMIKNRQTNYSIQHMVKIKEAIRQHKQALTFETQDRTISLNPSQKRAIPEGWKTFDFLHDYLPLKALTLPLEVKQK